jgi:membrane protease YdiL (CAAX protease family)
MNKLNVPPLTPQVRPANFFALTFVLSWLIWIPLTLSHFGIGPFHIAEGTSNVVRLLGVLMPAASAFILTAQTGGRSAVNNMLARLVLWRVHWKWWLAAVAGQPLLLGLAAFLFNWISTDSAIVPELPASAVAFIVNIIILLIATLGEEIGWRGVALPSLQQRHSSVKSSVLLGLLWATWHLPFWLLLDSFDRFGVGYLLLNFLFVLPLTFYITWFFNQSKQSLLLPVLLHLTFNIVNTILLPVTMNIGAFMVFGVFEWIIALIILPHMGLRTESQSAKNEPQFAVSETKQASRK